MALRSIREANFENQKVLARMDFNVEFGDDGEIKERFKLDALRKTIDYLADFSGVKIAMLTHFGRPKGKPDPNYSVAKLVPDIERALARKVVFVPDCIGKSVETALDELHGKTVLLLENVRFYPGEEENDEIFAKKLAEPFDIYVNEAFGADHRSHASLTSITKFLPAYAGLHVLDEVEKLDQVRLSPKHPAVAIIGGAKIETKLPLIRVFEEKYDFVLVGGKIANEAIDQKIVFSEKVLLPGDFASPLRLDIGPDTISRYGEIIGIAETIVWNGPMGKFEKEPYNIGTDAILHAVLESKAFVVAGGGESLMVLEKAGALDKIGFVSTGGGAMLEYLGGQTLPGLEVLEA